MPWFWSRPLKGQDQNQDQDMYCQDKDQDQDIMSQDSDQDINDQYIAIHLMETVLYIVHLITSSSSSSLLS